MNGTLNKVMLIGRLGDDVKVYYFEGGGSVARFPLATNDSYTNKQTGEKIESTEWHNITARNKLAEIFEKYLSKGDRIYIEGRLKTRQWTDQSGNQKYTTEIQVSDFNFLSTSRTNNKEGSNETHSGEPTTNYSNKNNPPAHTTTETSMPDDDDLPF